MGYVGRKDAGGRHAHGRDSRRVGQRVAPSNVRGLGHREKRQPTRVWPNNNLYTPELELPCKTIEPVKCLLTIYLTLARKMNPTT